MSNIINLVGNNNRLVFDLGEHQLVFIPTDERSKAVTEKANDLKKRSENINEDDEWVARKAIKELIDEIFTTMFDEDAPRKIYQAAGENTWSYLKIFMKISETVKQEQQKQLNDEEFKKYLAE
ncbi:TPA: hypothetical protein ACGOY6_001344 [Streptococcus suis]